METVKTKLIHDRVAETGKYNGLIHGCRTIFNQEGFWGMYKGLVPTMMKQGSNQAIRFTVYGDAKNFLLNLGVPEGLALLFAVGIAVAASVFGNTPIDVIK